MPNKETFQMKPVKSLLQQWITSSQLVIDPFARNSSLSWVKKVITNDINPETNASFHMDAAAFLAMLKEMSIVADVVLFDPPYSPRQISESYKGVGMPVTEKETQNARLFKLWKDGLNMLLKPNGVAVCFGWNSGGMGKRRGYKLLELLLINHGAAHNDTIVTVESKA